LKVVSSYFDSEWSFAQFKVNDRRAKLAFGPEDSSVYVAGPEGMFYSISYDPVNGGECLKQNETKI
jgi:hypothetical protein